MEIEFEVDGKIFHQFSENDDQSVEAIAADIIMNHMQGVFDFQEYETIIRQTRDMSNKCMEVSLELIDENIGQLYIKHNGNKWKRDKKLELREPGLIFVLLIDPKLHTISAYICFKMCLDSEGELVLYLYEIHVRSLLQGKGLGQLLINQFHKVAADLVKSSNPLYKSLRGTALTVFSDNERALRWYGGMDYNLTTDSPVDKVLRRGNVLKPDYYLLKRAITA
ncbi:hypothetical protein KGF57_002084 [Candida theae]|uniref:N-alpha-acetyltransferase 40 n=1 Tax=Candida theae TaxID=1198502 RepID=A0AAD5FZ58_9ASCO|nr:uncharacterized protein KGF57_002084 [Candida theae]KAI5959446.1 hypothetical protein KGF57_002084 [Candida theae]